MRRPHTHKKHALTDGHIHSESATEQRYFFGHKAFVYEIGSCRNPCDDIIYVTTEPQIVTYQAYGRHKWE